MNEEAEKQELSHKEPVGLAIALCNCTMEEFLEKMKGAIDERGN